MGIQHKSEGQNIQILTAIITGQTTSSLYLLSEILNPVTHTVTAFQIRAFKVVTKLKRDHYGRALIHYDWCSYKKKET